VPGEFPIKFADLVLSALAMFHLNLQVVTGVAKILFDSASNSYEPNDNYRPCDKKEKIR
jgi:hypothetical protein